MESYLMMLYVTFEQETALKSFFLEHGWSFCKPDLSVTTDKVGPASGPSVAVPSQLVAVVSTEDHSTLDSSREESDQTKTGKRKSKQGKGPAEKVAKLWVEAGSSLEDSTAGPTIIAVTSGSQAETLTTATMDKEEPTVAVKEETVYSDYDQGNDEAYENESTDTEDGYENTTGEVDGQEVEEGEVQLNLDSSMTVKPREVKVEVEDEDYSKRCPTCLKAFKKTGYLQRHIREVHNINIKNETLIQCPQCNETFTARRSFIRHRKIIHENLQKHKCQQCDEVFATRDRLIAHERLLHDRPKLQCATCKKEFIYKCSLDRHSFLHSPSVGATISCYLCGKLYSQRRNLDRHLKNSHSGGAFRVVCDICGMSLSTKHALKRHKHRVHK